MSFFGHLNAWVGFPWKQKTRAVSLGVSAMIACFSALTLTTTAATAFTGFQSVFDCGDVIGKVFEDKNGNGVQDRGEAGLPGVRLTSARGLTTTTDEYGRYHVTCAQLPNGGIGSIFLLKVDPRSLPIGHRVTTENPRTTRLTDGKVSKINFGTSASRVVRLELTGAAFAPNGTSLNPEWDAGIDQLIGVLGRDHSVLYLVYQKGAEGRALADKRLKSISRLVEQRWDQKDRRHKLEIERRMMVHR